MQKKENHKQSISTNELMALSDEFDNYDITDHLNESNPVDFEVKLTRRYFRLEQSLAEKITRISQKRGISPGTYVNLVLQEKILEEEKI